MRIGVDTGGTFTDCVALEGDRIKVLKVISTPEAAGRAVLEGIRRLTARFAPPHEIIHGTTMGTNSLLERRGARVGLITTAGFEDLLEIGRQPRPRLYDFNVQREPSLVPRALRLGITERTAADGRILLKPSVAELAQLRRRIKQLRPESLAVCFLFSFVNPTNERIVGRALRDLGLPISISHVILPEFREYERLSTVVTNAFLAPRMGGYLSSLERAVGGDFTQQGSAGSALKQVPGHAALPHNTAGSRIYVMQSSGGITTAASAAREPVRTILSGPAGGVVASAWLARQLGIRHAISFDMGGTSTDVCLLDGPPRATNETTLGGLPVAIPVLDVHSVGAGGGSLARIDSGGALRVGPESAGAVPGPICYGRSGTQPTVTDANLLLGRLDSDYFLGGEFRLDPRAAEHRFRAFLRGLSPVTGRRFKSSRDLARGIVAVSNATMEKALRIISVERGHDPRDFALICYGGAGGLHAADLARALRLPRVIVPRNPGAFSALGILLSDIVKEVTQSILLAAPDDGRESSIAMRNFLRDVERRFARLERKARGELRREGFAAPAARAERRLDLRYRGQSYELSVPFVPGFPLLFHREHERAYGYIHPGRGLEIVNLRLRLSIRTPKPRIRACLPRPFVPDAAKLKTKLVWFTGAFHSTPFYDREKLQPGARCPGPAVIVEYSSTTVVPPDFVCHADKWLNLVLQKR